MSKPKKSGKLLSICDCAKGWDIDREKDEIAKCQRDQDCYRAWDKFCYHYRPPTGHCDKNAWEDLSITTELNFLF